MNLTKFGISLSISFLMGLSFAYLISSLYRISWKTSLLGGLTVVIIYAMSIQNMAISYSLEWYITGDIENLSYSIIIIILISTLATLLVTDYYEQGPIRTIGYNDRLKEYIHTFSWAKFYSNPIIIAKERIDLQRSKTGTKMFFSFAFPLGILTFMNWFIDKIGRAHV